MGRWLSVNRMFGGEYITASGGPNSYLRGLSGFSSTWLLWFRNVSIVEGHWRIILLTEFSVGSAKGMEIWDTVGGSRPGRLSIASEVCAISAVVLGPFGKDQSENTNVK